MNSFFHDKSCKYNRIDNERIGINFVIKLNVYFIKLYMYMYVVDWCQAKGTHLDILYHSWLDVTCVNLFNFSFINVRYHASTSF